MPFLLRLVTTTIAPLTLAACVGGGASNSSIAPISSTSSAYTSSSLSSSSSVNTSFTTSSLHSSSAPTSSLSPLSSSSSSRPQASSSTSTISSLQSSSATPSSSSTPKGPFIDERNGNVVTLTADSVVIQSEDYTRAQDSDIANTGLCSSASGPVDYFTKQPGTLGTCDLGNTRKNEWLEYDVESPSDAVYDLAFSFATGNAGARSVQISINGDIAGSLNVPRNGGNAFSDLALNNMAFKKGKNTLRVFMTTGGVRFDAITFKQIAPTINGVSIGNTQAVTIPARIESEDYSRAFDADVNNTGPCEAMGPVDYYPVQANQPGSCDVGNTFPGEWLEYKISSPEAKNYDLDFSFATGNDGTREVQILLDEQAIGTLNIPRNGGTNFSDLAIRNISLPKGESTLKVFMITGGVKFDALEISEPGNGDELAVNSFSIMNTDTDTVQQGFNNLALGSTVDVNLDEIGTRNLVIKANTSNSAKSVYFGLNKRVQYALDNQAPFAIYPDKNGNYTRWTLFPGTHNISATPYNTKAADDEKGATASIKLNILQTEFTAEDNTLDMIAKNGDIPRTTLTIENTGNTPGLFTLNNMPNWLMANTTSGVLNDGASQAVNFSSAACSNGTTRDATIQLTAPNGTSTPIFIRQACTNLTLFDMALDRFQINQAVPAIDSWQAEGEQTPVIKGRAGLARAFISTTAPITQNIPVKLHYKTAGGETGEYTLNIKIDEDEETTYNSKLPASFFAIGTQYYVELDGENTIEEANNSNNRYPKTGYIKLNIQDVPRLNITFIPVIIDGENPNLNNDMLDKLMEDTVKLHPLENYNFTIRAQPYTYTGGKWGDGLSKIAELKKMDNSTDYYHGLVSKNVDPNSRTAGIAYLRSKSALSKTNTGVIAHEFGHNFSLSHTDCGGPLRPDNQYPYFDAVTNIWGYDILKSKLIPPTRKDFMSYCDPAWTSEHSYNKVMNYRGIQGSSSLKTQLAPAAPEAAIWVSGKITVNDGATHIALTNVFTGSHDFKASSGEFELIAFDDIGSPIYFTHLNTLEVDHADESHFLVALPKESIERFEIWQSGVLLHTTSWAQNNNNQQKASAPITAQRLDAQRVKISWLPTGLSSLTIKEVSSGAVLTNDQTGHVIVYSQDSMLNATLVNQGSVREQILNVE